MANFYQPKKKTSNSQKHLSVMVEKLDHQGVGIAYYNKKPVFIEEVLPQEQVLVQPIEEKSKFIKAKLISIQQESKQRVEPFCPHYGTCGGCNLQHLEHDDQIAHKAQSLQQLMKQKSGDDAFEFVAPIVSDDKGYRRRARISVLWDAKRQQLQFGFRQKASKQIANITDCPVLMPELNQLLPEIKAMLSNFDNLRALGHVEVVFDGTRKALMLRHTQALTEQESQLLVEFGRQFDTTIYWLANNELANSDSNEKTQLHCLSGEPLQCIETGNKIDFLPTDFIQVNENVNKSMVEQAVSWLEVTKTDRILDLFCGLGNFSLALAKLAESVVGVEGIQAMVDRATHNAHINQLSNLEFYQADLEKDFTQTVWAKKAFDKVLLDPARAGAAGIIDRMAELGAKRVVYVSCNPSTLARDTQSLIAQGYELKKLGMMDMFPHTSHLESMALFVYSGNVAKSALNTNKAKTVNQQNLNKKNPNQSKKGLKPSKLKLL